MHDHGIAGVEIGQGAFPNNEQLVALLKAANQVGIKVSLSHGPTQNPAGYSIDDDHARKTLVVGKAAVNAGETFDGHLPPPTLTAGRTERLRRACRRAAGGAAPAAPRDAGGRGGGRGSGGPAAQAAATLIAVLAYRCTQTPCPATGPVGTGPVLGHRPDVHRHRQEHGRRPRRHDGRRHPMDRAVVSGRRAVAGDRLLVPRRLRAARSVQRGRLRRSSSTAWRPA